MRRHLAHQELAISVLRGETTALPWRFLRAVYFKRSAARREIAIWADKYGIRVATEQRDGDRWVRFVIPGSDRLQEQHHAPNS